MYRSDYLEQVSKHLDWPIAHWDPEIEEILKEDANEKYIKPAEPHWLDFEVEQAVKES